jgi:hypothetical protein
VGSAASGNAAIWKAEGRPEAATSIRWVRRKQERIGGEQRQPDGETGGDLRRPGGGRGDGRRAVGVDLRVTVGHMGHDPLDPFSSGVRSIRTVGQIEERCDFRSGPTRILCRPKATIMFNLSNFHSLEL